MNTATVVHEGHVSGVERLRGSQTLAEVLRTATSFERSARDFYVGLAPKVSKRIRDLVHELAEEEQRHLDMFTVLSGREDILDQIQESVATPPSDSRFSDCIQAPDLGDKPDDQAVLQYAMGREQAAMEQYRSLADSAPAGPFRDIFGYLADEEMRHKLELEKQYYAIVHSGGV